MRKYPTIAVIEFGSIADGIYCGKAIDLLRSLVEDPALLEAPPELSPDQLAELGVAQPRPSGPSA